MYTRTLPAVGLILIIAILAAALAVSLPGCGGGSGPADVVVIPPPAPFTPVLHKGYSVYLVGGTYNAAYLPQTAADSFDVGPGCYKPVCLRASEIGTGQINTSGGMNWLSSFKDSHGNTIAPTPDGWELAPGICTGTTPNPGGGVITFTVHVVADPLGGLKVRMIPVDGYANRFTPDADANNGWKLPIVTPYRWVAEFTRDGAIVTQTRYSASVGVTSNSENLLYVSDGYNSGINPGIVTYSVYVYDNNNTTGGNSVVVDAITVNFYYIQ